eukprot:TRINITY_DN7473_c0_g1_i1.p1 TRINITY_DN7473_c0_g1~~TRINITY_DN7473_c0_g1_i1.p1  ORF type:complete len:199 (+),score=57.43 TRINITY_DN7473_c0_g1_i1:35-598(+)
MVDVIAAKHIITSSCLIKTLDIGKVSEEDMDFTAEFQLEPLPRPSIQEASKSAEEGTKEEDKEDESACYGIVLWFDTEFSPAVCQEKAVILSTSPFSVPTHWAQTILILKEPVPLRCPARVTADSEPVAAMDAKAKEESDQFVPDLICGRISIARSARHRSIDISLEITGKEKSGISKQWPTQLFDL